MKQKILDKLINLLIFIFGEYAVLDAIEDNYDVIIIPKQEMEEIMAGEEEAEYEPTIERTSVTKRGLLQ